MRKLKMRLPSSHHPMIYMRLAIVISCLCCFVAKINGQNDSIKSIQLNELVVTGENIYRHEDHLVIIPTNEQKKHSQTGYALLYNLMIPGLTISENGSVSTMGMNTGIYINGQPADVEDVIYLIPNDVDKVELYDFPTGKYSKNNMALNFVIKHYSYGGYVHLLGEQSLGINSGTYQASASLNKNSTTYSVFGGYGYADIKDIQTNSLEEYLLSNRQVSRETSTVQDLNSNITLLRAQCKFLKETDINYIALVYAGFTVRAVCLFMQLEYQHFFVKKGRLIKRIQNSDAPDKDLFISKIR